MTADSKHCRRQHAATAAASDGNDNHDDDDDGNSRKLELTKYRLQSPTHFINDASYSRIESILFASCAESVEIDSS